MASRIVTDSQLAIFVHQVEVPEGTKSNDLVLQGAVAGLAGFDGYRGDDGKLYTTVDTAARIRLAGVAVALTANQTVYLTPGKVLSTSSNAGANLKIGYAYRAKPNAASGDAWIQLIPSAG